MRRARLAACIVPFAAAALAMASACDSPRNRVLPPSTVSDTSPPASPPAPGASLASAASPAPAPAALAPAPVVESVFDTGLKAPWQDYGWAKRELVTQGPARVDFTANSGWIIAKPGLDGRFGALVFTIKPQNGEADFLEARVGADGVDDLPAIKIDAAHRRELADGWFQVIVPMTELNPDDRGFDRIVLRAHRVIPAGFTLLDKIGFTGSTAPPKPPFDPASAKAVDMVVECKARPTRINPLIYGIAYNAQKDATDDGQWNMGATIRRWGGNPTTRYNWQLGNAWSTAYDWFWENVPIPPYTTFLRANADHGMKSALTVPTIGWVAKDTTSSSFPTSLYPSQQQTDGYRPTAGNGKSKDGKELTPPPPTTTSTPAPPEFIKKWIETIRKADAQSGHRSVDEYILDNEPALWSSSHRDVHPEPLSYDELLDRTLRYASAIRSADPGAVIAGPAAWGWPEYFFSAKDATAGFEKKPDRLAHGDVPLIAWYLQKLRAHEQKTGTRLLDVLDVHYYPQSNVYSDKTDRWTSALRLRMTRELWDPTYKDESWIKDVVMLIPRMQELIAQNYPGLGFSIGEYSFGAENHMSGALAEAEALGRFGQSGLTSAFYWTYPPAKSAVLHAFRAYRNFDGRGGHFEDLSVPARASAAAPDTSIFVSKDESGHHMVAILLNFSPDTGVRARIPLGGCGGSVTKVSAYSYGGGPAGLQAVQAGPTAPKVEGSLIEIPLAPYSISVVDIFLG